MADDNGRDLMKFLSKLLDLFKKLPLNKVTGHQAFDLFFDLIMVGALWVALKAALSAESKVSLAIICLFFSESFALV